MPINVLFSLKNCKNRQAPDPLASGSWELRLLTPASVILHCEFSLHLPTNHRGINHFLYYSGSAPGIRRRKNMLHFVYHRLRKL